MRGSSGAYPLGPRSPVFVFDNVAAPFTVSCFHNLSAGTLILNEYKKLMVKKKKYEYKQKKIFTQIYAYIKRSTNVR